MDEKKTFGAYILRRRRELGMTQREFAEKLYVTESAVSKWERGLSYPDITLLRSICAVLDITEHELLTGSEDSEKRTSERLASKYLRMTRRWRAAQYLVYGAIVIGCFLGDVLSGQGFGWFFIALTSCMTAASITLVPSVVSLFSQIERYSMPIAAGCFTVSLELLLLSGCIWSGGDWFAVAAAGTIFGLSIVLLPMLQKRLPLPEFWLRRSLSGYLLLETVLLILLLLVSCIWSGGNWFAVAAVGTIFGLGFVILPVLLRQMPLPEQLKKCRASLYLTIQTALLILLLLVSCIYSGGDWFIIAAVSTLFGLGFFILPVLLRQLLPQPFSGHKALVYFILQTIGLFAVLICADMYSGVEAFLSVSLPIALICLALPWGIMLVCRYLPLSGLLRASIAVLWLNGWIWLFPKGMDRVMVRAFGVDHADPAYTPWRLDIPYDFSLWGGAQSAYNAFAIVLFSLLGVAILLAIAGVIQRLIKKK